MFFTFVMEKEKKNPDPLSIKLNPSGGGGRNVEVWSLQLHSALPIAQQEVCRGNGKEFLVD